MDDIRLGSIVRAVRIRRGWRQADLAQAAGLSQSAVSTLERGLVEEMSVHSVRRIAGALGIRLPFAPHWRGAEVAKLLDERHAAIVKQVIRRLIVGGWTCTAEVTFAIGRESGSVDVVAWHAEARAMLLVEVKSELVDLQETLATFDRKRRLSPQIARQLGLRPLLVGAVLALPDERQARLSVLEHAVVLDSGYPARTVEVRRWLAAPGGGLRGIWFVPISGVRNARRVRLARKRPAGTAGSIAAPVSSVNEALARAARQSSWSHPRRGLPPAILEGNGTGRGRRNAPGDIGGKRDRAGP